MQLEFQPRLRCAIQTLVVATAYFALARTSQWFELSSVGVIAVYPPAGLALASLLIGGRGLAVAVWIGAFAFDLWFFMDTRAHSVNATTLSTSALMATGVTLQAWVATTIIRRRLPRERFSEGSTLLQAVLIGGPLCCTIGATVALASLYSAGYVAPGEVADAWWAWWLGDSIGVAIIVPVACSASWNTQGARLRWALAAAVPVILGAIGVLYLFRESRERELDRVQRHFGREADFFFSRIDRNIESYREFLHSVEGLFMGSDQVEEHDFQLFATRALERLPGLRRVLWIPRISAEEFPAFIERVRSNRRDFELVTRPIREDTEAREGPYPFHYPVLYEAGVEGTRPVIGMDLAASPFSVDWIERAIEYGNPIVSRSLRLASGLGVAIVHPVRKGGDLLGVVATTVLLEDLVGGALPALERDVYVSVRDRAAGGYERLLFDRRVEQSPASEFAFEYVLPLTSRDWEVQYRPSLHLVHAETANHPFLVLLCGLLLLGLIEIVVLDQYGRHLRIQRLVASQTREIQAALEEVRFAKEEADLANSVKTEFLTNMSHELRTPITAILGFAEVLAEQGRLDAGQSENVATIRRNGERLLALVDNILDFSQVEEEGTPLHVVTTDLERLFEQTVESARDRGVEGGVDVELEWRRRPGGVTWTDPTFVQSILSELLENALRFTESGSVRVVGDIEEGVALHFQVIDTGIGIAGEKLESIFEPFSQVDYSLTRRFGGAGLGLTLVHDRVTRLGGSIEVDSRPGRGTTFSVTIPVHTPTTHLTDPPSAAEAADPDGAIPTVLLAEDLPDNQRLIRYLLGKLGLEVHIAENGWRAVNMARARQQAGEPYPLILMDMQMPRLDGYEATTRLRTLGYDGTIIAVTAHTLPHDQDRCLAAGCDDYLPKPINRTDLSNLVLRYLESEPTPA